MNAFRLASLAWISCVVTIQVMADPILPVAPIYQNDPQWSGETLDHTSTTIGQEGCSLTAWTMLIDYQLQQQGITQGGKPISYTPSDLNNLLNNYQSDPDPKNGTKYDGWGVPLDQNGKPTGPATSISFGGLLDAVKKDTEARSDNNKGLVLKQQNSVPENPNKPTKVDQNYKPLKDAIASNDPVIVRVNGGSRDNPQASGHTVLVIGIDDKGNWIINDPYQDADPQEQITSLSDPFYGNTIYEYWWGVFQAGGRSDPYQEPSPYPIDPQDLLDPTLNPNMYAPFDSILNTSRTDVPEPASLVLVAVVLGIGLSRLGYSSFRRAKER